MKELSSWRVTYGIHLDNRDHATLEHCLSTDGSKLLKLPLNILVLLDAKHLRRAKAHWDIATAELKDQEMVCLSLTVSISILISAVSYQGVHSHTFDLTHRTCWQSPLSSYTITCYPPRSLSQAPSHFWEGQGQETESSWLVWWFSSELARLWRNKHNQDSQSSRLNNPNPIVAPMEDIWQALIAQLEPQSATISSLHMYSLTSVQHLTNSFSSHSVLSNLILVISYQTIGNAYLSPMHHWLWFQVLDARSPASKWFYLLQYHW